MGLPALQCRALAVCRQKLVSAATTSAVTDAVHSAPAPLPSTIRIPPWHGRAAPWPRDGGVLVRTIFTIHTILLFQNVYTQDNEGNHSLEDEEDDESEEDEDEDDDEGGENFSETEIFELF